MSRYSSDDTSWGVIILGIIVVLTLSYFISASNRDEIRDKVAEVGGTVTSIDSKIIDYGPFYVKSKSQTIYEVKYIDKNGEDKDLWVRTGIWYDWVWDYKR